VNSLEKSSPVVSYVPFILSLGIRIVSGEDGVERIGFGDNNRSFLGKF
jgi:hypothetical protein